jgi:Cys-rich four helix bundle protein (predicted Tat secretion target)
MSKFESALTIHESIPVISRRKVMLGLGAAAAAAVYTGTANAEVHVHDHSKHAPHFPELLDAANSCLDKGQRCIAHCLVSFKEGDITMADCASKVHEMHAICDAFSYLLASNSEYIKAYASICENVCSDCEKECLKHKEHIECKACAEACADLVDQIKLKLS